MNVSLTPELEEIVRKKVESGKYATASEVVREALRIMDRDENRRLLVEAVDAAYEQVDRGETTEFTRAVFEQVKAQAKANILAGHQVSDLVKP